MSGAVAEVCPACFGRRMHTPDEWKQFHPLAGHGYTKEIGYTHKDLDPKNVES